MAMKARCRCPPESSGTGRSANAESPQVDRASSTISLSDVSICAKGPWWGCLPHSTSLRTLIGGMECSWERWPISWARCLGRSSPTLRSKTLISPSHGLWIALASLRREDFPHPFGPMMLVIRAFLMSSDSPSKRVRSPYPKDMLSKRSLSIESDLPLDQHEVDEEGPAKQRQHDTDGDFVR